MFTTVITDCWGENEKGRQVARYNSLHLGPTNLIGVSSDFSSDATIEAGGNLIDILDAIEGNKGLIILNVAPRGDKKDGGNGTHFSFFYYKNTLVISTIKGYCLSFINKFNLVKNVNLVELTDVLNFAHKSKLISKESKNHIVNSQFRSFDFVPRLARWLIDNVKVPSKTFSLENIPFVPKCLWHIDAFGNAKTTVLSNEVNFKHNNYITTNYGTFRFYNRLKDVPNGETAIYIGSSGLSNNRFLEIATQGVKGSVAKTLKIKVGDNVEMK